MIANEWSDVSKLAPAVTCILQMGTLIVAMRTFAVVYRQMDAALNALRLSTMMQRRDMYIGLTNTLPPEDVQTMLLHVFDHFDADVYLKRYQGHPDRIRSYFLMKRKYLYLLLSTHLNTQDCDPAKDAPAIWLRELCRYQEFRDVHASQGHYYPAFAAKVDKVLRNSALKGWALNQSPVDLQEWRKRRPGQLDTSFLSEDCIGG